MPNLTKCYGKGCKLKFNCYRYTVKPFEKYQGYYLYMRIRPYKCEYYLETHPFKFKKWKVYLFDELMYQTDIESEVDIFINKHDKYIKKHLIIKQNI